MTPGEGATWWQEYVSPVIGGVKEALAIASVPGAALVGGSLWNAWTARRKERAERRAEGRAEHQTAEQRRADAFAADLARLDAGMRQHVELLSAERIAAQARADKAEAELDAARAAHEAEVRRLHDERWRLELRLDRHSQALANTRRMVNALEGELRREPTVWHPVEGPPAP